MNDQRIIASVSQQAGSGTWIVSVTVIEPNGARWTESVRLYDFSLVTSELCALVHEMIGSYTPSSDGVFG